MESESGMVGLDVELMQLFIRHLGVRYKLVKTTWIEQVNIAVTEMDKVTQQNAATAEESASASEELSA